MLRKFSKAIVPLQPLGQLIIDPFAGPRHALGVFERNAFRLGKQLTVAPPGHLGQFRLSLIAFPHTEGIDVDSERAAVQRRDPQIDERQQPRRQLSRFLDRGA